MWVFIISLCLPILVTSSEDICERIPFDVCPSPLHLKNIETPDDVKAICPQMIDNIVCLGNYSKKCGDDGPVVILSMEGEYESILQLRTDICDESTLLHAALMENLGCLKNAIVIGSNDACYNNEQNVVEEYSTYLNSEASLVDEGKKAYFKMCLNHLYNITCYVEDVAKSCGILAKDAIIEVLHRAYYLQAFCTSNKGAEEFAEDIGRLKMTNSQQQVLKELLDKILENQV